ncbi:MAG TPA: sulfate adenylyltransferase, partial [Paenibacillus sp.]|nr:sulfate adenylyltransferase [Paenibacillus sp.]
MTSICPHGGTLVNRVVEGTEREELLNFARDIKAIALNTWTLSDLDLIAVGAFSPLTGFLNEQDYHSVVKSMRLADGTVWSI